MMRNENRMPQAMPAQATSRRHFDKRVYCHRRASSRLVITSRPAAYSGMARVSLTSGFASSLTIVFSLKAVGGDRTACW